MARHPIRLLFLLAVLFPSCIRVPGLPAPTEECRFRIDRTFPGTRSLLTADDIESKITTVTLAAYRQEQEGGRLFTTRHFSARTEDFLLRIPDSGLWNIYAFVNMGDLTERLPDREDGLQETRFRIPAYPDINAAGLPMSGRIEGFRSGTMAGATIPVRRLFAKITASISCDWEGASVREVKVKNLNGSCPLYGPASAGSSSEMMDGEELDRGGKGTFVFYVPENRQGKLSGISEPGMKDPGKHAGIAAKRDVLTYLEATVSVSGPYEGTLVYRSYLGDNATDNFDLKGNVDYRWTLLYHENGLQENTWKTDTGDLEDCRTLEWTENPIYVRPGKTYLFADYLSSNIPLSRIIKTFSGTDRERMIGRVGSDSFSILSSAQAGMSCTAEARPERNSHPSLIRTTLLRIASRVLEWKGFNEADRIAEGIKVFRIRPRKSTEAFVYYAIPPDPSEKGKGGAEGSGAEWTYSVPPDQTGKQPVFSASYVSGSSSDSYDRIIYSASQYALPGDYPVSVRSADGSLSDPAVLRVEETKYLCWQDQPENPVKHLTVPGTNPSIFDNQPLFITGFILGDRSVSDTGDWGWRGSMIRRGDNLSFLTLSLPESLTRGSDSAIRASLLCGRGQEEAVNAKEYQTLCGVLQLYHPYCSFPPGDHEIRIGFEGEPSPGLTLILHITESGGDIHYEDICFLEPEDVTLPVGGQCTFGIHCYRNLFVDNRVIHSEEREFSTSEITWTSSDESVATVDENGTATALSAGTAEITVRYIESGKIVYETLSSTLRVVTGDIHTYRQELSLAPEEATIDIGARQPFSAILTSVHLVNGIETDREETPLPPDQLTWSSGNPAVATVQDGTATGVASGTATVTAVLALDGKFLTASATLKVEKGWESVLTLELSPQDATLIQGTLERYTARLVTKRYRNGILQKTDIQVLDNQSLNWSSDRPDVASVEKGTVTGISKGTAVITATCLSDGISLQATARVTVKNSNGILINTGWDWREALTIE